MTDTPFSDLYSRCYDLLYRDKDYRLEATYVSNQIRQAVPHATSLLELGCGTGKHAPHFIDAGFAYTGLDRSSPMIAQARNRCDQGAFFHQAIGEHTIECTYDAVAALFHVMSYQDTNEAVRRAFRQARTALRPGGVFLFDFWYGPAVLSIGPEERRREVKDAALRVHRTCMPRMRPEQNVVEIHYQLQVTEKATDDTHVFEETHRMRYFFIPELTLLAELFGFFDARFFSWLTAEPLRADCWSGLAVLRTPDS